MGQFKPPLSAVSQAVLNTPNITIPPPHTAGGGAIGAACLQWPGATKLRVTYYTSTCTSAWGIMETGGREGEGWRRRAGAGGRAGRDPPRALPLNVLLLSLPLLLLAP